MSLASAGQVIERCESTNDLARALGEQGAPHGTWISARVQERGRGRLGRQWQSFEGNLFLSLIARIENKAMWTWVPLATAVGVARFAEARFPALDVRIKWPNDLWWLPPGAAPGSVGAKLGGILCEAVGNRTGSFIVIGLGLNCLHAPEGIDQPTSSLSEASGARIVADDVRTDVIGHVRGAVDELEARGPDAILRDFERKAALPRGTRIEWTPQGATAGGEPRTATVQGLGPSGELIVREEPGEIETKLYAEDVRVRLRATAPGPLRPRASDGSPA